MQFDAEMFGQHLGHLVRQCVQKAVAELPKPENGKDADPEAIAAAVRRAFDELPKPENGKDADPAVMIEAVRAAVAELPPPKDGKDGKDADPQFIKDEIQRLVSELPAPVNGKDADPEMIAAAVREAVDAIPAPKDGTSVSIEEVRGIVAEEVGKAAAEIPRPKDGESVPIETVQKMVDEAVTQAMKSIRLPKDGEPGRDAAHIEIIPAINTEKSYPRGTYATHAGGFWRSFEATSGMKGWECLVDGVAWFDMTQDDADPRRFVLRSVSSSGAAVEKAFTLPAMIYRQVFKEGQNYEAGDTVTWAGSLWHCNGPTTEKPGDGDAWTLAAKRGRDGKQ